METSHQTNSTTKPHSNPSQYTVKDFNRLWDTDAEFRKYARQVYHYLETMRENRRLSLLRIPKDKLKWLLITAVAFISEGVHFLSYEFTDDFTAIRHIHADEWEVEKAIAYKNEKLKSNNHE